MAGIDKAAFMKRLSAKSAAPGYGETVPGAEPSAEMPPDESGPLSCGEQLIQALDSGDPAAVDAALQEAVRKYSGA